MIYIRIIFLLVLTSLSGQSVIASAASQEKCISNDCVEKNYDDYRNFIKQRLNRYNDDHSAIYFIHLPNHDEWIASIMALEMLLGYQPTSLDFEHPPELAQDLVYVTAARIQKMLFYGHSAAFLFKRGEQAVAKRENICVITMNPEIIAASSQAATSYMLTVPEAKLETLSATFQLDGTQLLEYIIDHEAAHCLDSYYNGPVPMSDKDLWGQYKHYQREMFADTYALSKHIKQYGKDSAFVENFISIRKLCLINGDPGTCTAERLTHLLDDVKDSLASLSEKERLALITEFNKSKSIEYNQFVNFLFSAIKVMQLLKVDLDETCCDLKVPANYKEDKQLINSLLNTTRSSYREIFDSELKPLTSE